MINYKVSVVMPVYNGAAFIGQAIDSVELQAVPLELIIVDDDSTDGTESIIRAYEARWQTYTDKKLIYIKNKARGGAAQARNLGVGRASAPFVAFLDADDWWTEDKLPRQLECIHECQADLCSTARALVDAEGKSLGKMIPVKKRITYGELLKHNSINCSSLLIRTDVIRKYPMAHADSHEDYITWLKILRDGYKACGINEPMLNYRYDSHSKSGNKLKSAGMTYKVYRYMGFSTPKSVVLFISYAIHGILKYAR